MAPSARVSSPLTRRLASKNCFTPRPSQVGQAPAGLLKENSLGSSSLIEWPQIGQAKRAEKIISSLSSSSSMEATRAMPSASFSAVSKDSARRCCRSLRTLKRSTTTSIECFFCLSSLGSSSSSYSRPLTRARTKPWARSSSNTARCSPLRSRITGASSISLRPSGSAST